MCIYNRNHRYAEWHKYKYAELQDIDTMEMTAAAMH